MNKRIQELAEQAGFNLHNDPIDGHDNTHEINKFAELIVKECANEIQSLLDCNSQVDDFDQGVYNGLDMAKLCIKEHFGVEE